MNPRTNILTLLLAVAALTAAGCAGTAASVKPTTAAAKAPDLALFRGLALQVSQAGNLAASDAELERIHKRIVEAIRKQQADRFLEITKSAPGEGTSPVLHVSVELTRYEKGNAFARAMLAGLGQMHIAGKVTLKDLAAGTTLGEYSVKKTFAWGGIYGATTTIEDVEAGFAEGVAALVLGRQ